MHLSLSRLPRTFACWAALSLLGCLPAAPPDLEEPTVTPTLSHVEGSDTGLAAAHRSEVAGEAVATAETFQGTESLEITDEGGQLLCRWTWDTHSVDLAEALPAAAADCALPDDTPCAFAHAVALTNGRADTNDTGLETDCGPFRSLHPMQTDGGVKGYGYGASDEGTFLVVFADNPAPEPDLWIPLLGAGTYRRGP